jgi:hypothetical protein
VRGKLSNRASRIIAAAAGAAIAFGPVTGFARDIARVVTLPGGTAIDLGHQASLVERAVDEQWIGGAARDLLDKGLGDDAAAILGYAARYRPERAAEFAVLGGRLAEQRNDTYFASLAVGAVTAESADPAAIARALTAAGLDPTIQAAALAAAGAPAAGRSKGGAAEGASTPGGPKSFGNGADFRGSMLPEMLRIGGGASGNGHVPEPSKDGGAS